MNDTLICMTCGKSKEEGLHAGSHSWAMQHEFVGSTVAGEGIHSPGGVDTASLSTRTLNLSPKEKLDL
jgi:hypothetical protein